MRVSPSPRFVLDLDRLVQLGIQFGILVPATIDSDADDISAIPSASDTTDPATLIDDARFAALLRSLPHGGPNDVEQRDILAYIQTQLEGSTMASIAAHFGLEEKQVVGKINGGLQKNIKKAGFPSIDPVLWLQREGGRWRIYPGEVLKRQPPVAR